MNTNDPAPLPPESVRAAVRDRYGKIPSSTAPPPAVATSCCGPGPSTAPSATGREPVATGCCGGSPVDADAMARALGYSANDTAAAPIGSNLGLGCGNPLGIQSLQSGETVLDLGSGAGFDTFLAARAVGPSGRVIGVDMTPEMLGAARANLAKSRFTNVEFRLGEIENLPVADASIDVILSNCVINLSPEKERVFAEAFRVLRPGGRLSISDVVALSELSPAVRADLELHTGCVAGAATIGDLHAMLTKAGFLDVRIEPKIELQNAIDGWFPERGLAGQVASANISARKPAGKTKP